MSIMLRLELIILVFIFLIIVVKNINNNKLHLEYSFIWILISIVLLLMSFCPNIIINFSYFLGFEKSSNFVFFICFICLITMFFYLTIIISKQSEYLKKIIQYISIENYYLEHNNKSKRDSHE